MTVTLLSDAQLATFERDGYVTLGRIVEGAHLDALLAAEQAHRIDLPFAATGAVSKLVVTEQLCDHSTAVRRFCLAGNHLPVLGQLLGPNVAFTHTQFITKLPDDVTEDHSWIPLHQDDGYGRLEPPIDVTVWTALSDTDERNGCLVVVPGSHRDGIRHHARVESNRALREAYADGAIAVPLAAGEAVAFTGLTLHGSGPNRSGAERVGMHARYCDPSVRMVIHDNQPVLADAHSWMVLGEAPRS